jgi:NhaP-type Na+/H+ or K+/H+ antiporter
MPSLIGVLIGLIVAVVAYWLLSMAVPNLIAALVALVLFLVCVFGSNYHRGAV